MVAALSVIILGEANLTAAELVKWVNERLKLDADNCYSESKPLVSLTGK